MHSLRLKPVLIITKEKQKLQFGSILEFGTFIVKLNDEQEIDFLTDHCSSVLKKLK